MSKMRISIVAANLANHPNYDRDVARCGNRHGLNVRQWSGDVWFCCMCGHRVQVTVQGNRVSE
jgi:hypothetical protein